MTIFLSSFFSSKNAFSNQKDCIEVVYEPTICVNEEVRFSLKAKGTCTISDIKWNFGSDATIKTFDGAEPVLLAFKRASTKDITIQYFDHEKEESVSRIIPLEVIEPVSQISINQSEPCVGQTIELTTVGPVAGFYIWKGGNLPEDGISGNLEYKIIDEFKKSNQKYTLEWYVGKGEGDGGCMYRPFSKTVVEKALEPIEFEQDNILKVCEGDEVSIDIKNPGALQYNWNCSEDDYSLIKVGSSIKFSPQQSCEIKVTANDGDCIRSGTINIEVQKVPEIEIYPKKSMICAGSSVRLKVIGAIPGETYIWSGNVFPQNTYANVVMVEPESSDEYEVTWVSGKCTVSASASVEVSNITDILEDKIINICEGETVNLQVARPNDGTIEWSGGDIVGVILGEEIEVSPKHTTTYSVLWQNNICNDSGTVTVQVNPMPEINLLNSVNGRVCKGEEVVLTAELSNSEFENNFTWQQTKVQKDIRDNNTEFSFTATESHNIVAEWRDENNLCYNKVRVALFIEVIDRPIEIDLESNTNTICYGDTVHFEITGANDESKYILVNLDDTVTIGTDELIGDGFSIMPEKTTNYVAWWVKDCTTISDTIQIEVNPLPSITIDTSEKICPYENFSVKVIPDEYDYNWTGGNIDGGTIVGGSTLSRNAGDNVLVYNLKVVENECRLDTTVKINLVDISADITTNLQPFDEVCKDNAIQFEVSGGDNYIWEPANLLSDHLSDSPIVPILDVSTKFRVTSYKDGCELTEEIEIKVIAGDCEIILDDLEIPNAITPNRDGKNDYWIIPGIEGNPNFNLTIFNANGAIIYDGHSYQNNFDGYNNGKIPEGTYYYVIVRKDGLDKRTGTLTIIR